MSSDTNGINSSTNTRNKFSTKAIHGVQQDHLIKKESTALVPEITLSTTFKLSEPKLSDGYIYARLGNPTRTILENTLASLDDAKHCLTFSSGLACCSAVAKLLNVGDNIVAMDDLYGGTNSYFRNMCKSSGISTTFVDARNIPKLRDTLQPNTKLVWIETPTNPTLRIVDIKEVVKTVGENCPNALVLVDNTFETCYFQRPLELGADLVYYSCTKYINGHGDVVMGSVSTNNTSVYKKLQFIQLSVGAIPSPFDCYLVIRGIKTLQIRMEKHQSNSLIVANFLQNHPNVLSVLHPGLPSHPNYDVAQRQLYGHSGMVSVYLSGGINESRAFLKALKYFTLAVSLGGYESLAELPCTMTHSTLSEEELVALGITDNFVRLSVGLEAPDDLVKDLEQALVIAYNR